VTETETPSAPADRPGAAPPDAAAPDEAPPSRFSFSVPSDWVHVDVTEEGPAAARAFVRRLVEGSPQRDKKREIQAAAALQGTVRKARRQGAVMAAFWSRRVEERLVGASVVVALRPLRPDAALDAHGTVDLDRAVRTVAGAEAGESILESSLVELPAGPARRLRKVQVVDALGARHETQVVQFFVLAPDRRQLVVITFSTPTVELAEPLAELFDALACSLRWRT
jgi:hypothetical protein